jgi:hypothetical protein
MDLIHRRFDKNSNAVSFQGGLNGGGGGCVFVSKQLVRSLDECHLRAKSSECLGHLTTDWPATDDGQPFRKLGQRKDRLIGEITHVGEAGNLWLRRTGSGGNDSSLESQGLATDFDGVRPRELAASQKDVDSQTRKSSDRIVASDLGS